jgi:hypothetical protein
MGRDGLTVWMTNQLKNRRRLSIFATTSATIVPSLRAFPLASPNRLDRFATSGITPTSLIFLLLLHPGLALPQVLLDKQKNPLVMVA